MLATMLMFACSDEFFIQDGDGPMDIGSDSETFDGLGYFLRAKLDNGSPIHLKSDTLYVHMDSIWTFSNCALKSIRLYPSRQDSVLSLKPIIQIHTTASDCSAPFFRPDTVIKITHGQLDLENISEIHIVNDKDSVLASIKTREGSFALDTFSIYVDSLFSDFHELPLRTKSSPSMLRVLDSLDPRVHYYRTMESVCQSVIDNCSSTVKDTLLPQSWPSGDTVLVPVHIACADTDLIYCGVNKWKNDSTKLGKVLEYADTVWYTSSYYVEEIPSCGTLKSFTLPGYSYGKPMNVVRNLFVPDKSEKACGPASREDLLIINIAKDSLVTDSARVDSLYEIWKSAKVAPSKNKK
ncbi:MAG: hypothetical protein HUK21_06160 [Fibrobacteraceae bacterium]|nr:hypothetical protein [Fibrobacteraceae bacterium]